MKKYLRLASALVIVCTAAAFTSYVVAAQYINVTRVGTYIMTPQTFDSATGGQLGLNETSVFNAGESLFVGRTVYISANNTVKMDSTLASYNKVAGVVIGGTRTSLQGSTDSLGVGVLAATTGQRVLVLRRGRTWVVIDTGAGIAPGSLIQTSNKAGQRGKVMAKPAALDSLMRVIGRLVDSGVTSRKTLADINVR